MIDQRLVGDIIRGNLVGHQLTATEAELIVDQRVATPVHSLLQAQHDAADEQAASILDDAARRARAQSLLLMYTSNGIATMLNGWRIRALVYKGVALAAGNGQPWRGRESSDVDVLVDVRDVPAAHESMTRNGLVRVDGERCSPSPLFRYHDIEMAYLGLPAVVDLHWRLEAPGYLDAPFATLWANRRRVTRDGLDVWTLGKSDALLLSAVHGTRERWRSLRQMLDAGMQLSGLSQDEWRVVAEQAHAYGAAKSLAVALGIAHACGVPNLPARPGQWARTIADLFLVEWAAGKQGVHCAVATTPAAALNRRIARWRLASSISAGLDGLARASVRQVLHKRSWNVTMP